MFVANRPASYDKPYAERLVIMSRRAALFMGDNFSFKGWTLV